MILFYARKRYATCSSDDKLTTGSVGIEVVFHFSDDWEAAPARIAVFRGSGQTVDVHLTEDSCTVPPEVLTQPGSTLTIGVYGTDGAGTVVIPTVYAEAGQIRRGAEPSGVDPTPQTQPLIDQLLAAAQAARDAADEAERLAKSVNDAADAGEFDGEDGDPGDDGNGIWWTVSLIDDESMAGQVYGKILSSWLKGRSGEPAVHDLVVGPAVGTSRSIGWLYEIIAVSGIYCNLHGIGSIKGAPGDPGAGGYAPEVTIETITGGHRVTITDEAHPSGQSFDVMDGQGGSGTGDYDDLTNKPSIEGVTLSGNKTASDLGLAKASDIPVVPVQSVNNKTGAVVLNASDVGAGTYSKPSGGIPASDLASAVQNSLNKVYTPVKLGFGYAICSTAEAIVSKTAALSSYTLTTGGIVAVKFTNAVPAGATLNINSKGAKAIYYKGAAITAGVIKAGDTVTMIYSTYYHVLSIDRDIPAPSDSNPMQVSYGSSSAGVSAQFARSDHTHELDPNILIDVLLDATASNIPVFLYDGQNGVYIRREPQELASAFRSQLKMNFALVVPPDYNSYPVLFTPSKFDTTTGELHLTGIVGGVLYEATLLPGADPTGQSADLCMVGTMTTTNLALPSAQGVSF